MTHIMTPEAVEVVTEVAVQELIEAIKEDYSTWSLRSGKSVSDIRLKMIEEFNTDIGFSEGKKYIKITQRNGGCVWGFVVNCDNDAKFKRGDILKPANFNSYRDVFKSLQTQGILSFQKGGLARTLM